MSGAVWLWLGGLVMLGISMRLFYTSLHRSGNERILQRLGQHQQAADNSGVDDGTAASRTHAGQHGLGQLRQGDDVEFHLSADPLGGDLVEGAECAEAGVVDQGVNLRGAEFLHQRGTGVTIRQVTRSHPGLDPVCAAQLVGQVLETICPPCDQQ